MSKPIELPEGLSKDCTRVGYSALTSWMSEHHIKLGSSDNWLETLRKTIESGDLTLEQLSEAVAELDENSDKKIFLMQIENPGELTDKKKVLQGLNFRDRIIAGSKKWVNGSPTANGNPTFINLYWEDDLLKIKYSELQWDSEADFENNRFIRTERRVNIVYVIDPVAGFVQLRLDSPGMIHHHKGDTGKSSETAYDAFYKDMLNKLLPDLVIRDLNLNGLANYLAGNEMNMFRINKGITTISNNAKQTYATGSAQADVRNLPEYAAAAALNNGIWRTEDLTGYWIAASSGGELTKDLFMRISRRSSQIRVQRGCLEKELNYGIGKIREIQNQI